MRDKKEKAGTKMDHVKNIELNEQFRKALYLLEKTNKSVFITGKAGTGKSTLLSYFCEHTKKPLVVLAPTGVGAVNVSGQTIHSFFGFKPDTTLDDAEKIAKKMRSKRKELFKKLDAIVIDEISMARADLLDCVDIFLRTILKNQLQFAGIQMIFFGDLYQLPPVVIGKERNVFKTNYKTPYFFDAKAMNNFQVEFIELEKVYRQKDKKFIEILNSIRNNTITDAQLETINQRVNEDIDLKDLGHEYVYLTTINRLADQINRINMEELPGRKYVFEGEITGEFDKRYLPTETELEVKESAQIMLLNNDSRGRWINGTIGEIIDFEEDKINIKLQNGKTVSVSPYSWDIFETYFNKEDRVLDKHLLGSFIQYPIRLAWAITIHKSQGKTFDRAVIDLSGGTFACGQTYVALSRCRTLEGMILKTKIKKTNIFTDWRIVRFMTNYQYGLSERNCPEKRKIEIIEEAIKNRRKLKIIYLKNTDEKSQRTILPERIGEMEYRGKKYLGIEAYCFLRNEKRTFRIDRILEMSVV